MIQFKPVEVVAQEIPEQAPTITGNERKGIGVTPDVKKVRGAEETQDYPVVYKGNFWNEAIVMKSGSVEKKFTLDYPRFEGFVNDAGYAQMLITYKDKADQYEFIGESGKVIKLADIRKIKNDVLDWTRRNELTELRGNLMRGASRYFSKDLLTCLPVREITFKKDTATKCFIYFRNCFVEVSLDESGEPSIKPKPYTELDGSVWASQVLDRDFHWNANYMEGDFARFVKLAVNKPTAEFYDAKMSDNGKEDTLVFNEKKYNTIYYKKVAADDGSTKLEPSDDTGVTEAMQKLLAVMCGMGYMMHGHKSMSFAKMFAIFDAKYSRDMESMGRSGKSLVFKAVAQMVPTVFIDGKDVNFAKEKETFNGVTRATRVIVFNDVKPNFDFTNLFHKITEGIQIKRLYQDPVTLTYEESPKFGLTGNFALRGSDDSSMDRQAIGELQDFFTAKHKPVHFFGRDFWSEQWSEADWNKFDSFMLECIASWLTHSFIPFPDLNYHYKQLAQTVRPEFIDFMEAEDDGKKMIQYGTRYAIKDLYKNYTEAYPDFDKLTQHSFTKNLKLYCKHFGILINPHLKDGRDRNKGIDYVTLYTVEEWESAKSKETGAKQNEIF